MTGGKKDVKAKRTVVGLGRYVDVSALMLDGRNPRFKVDSDPTDQLAVAIELADRYDALEIARKIALNGFHAAEPPAVIDNGDMTFTVLEGNRRVTALKGLQTASLRKRFADAGQWESAAEIAFENGHLVESVPVVVYPSREAAATLLSARHIVGAKKWEPMQQDRYITDLVDSGNSFKEAADITGKTPNEIKEAYRNYRLITRDIPRLKIAAPAIEGKYTVLQKVWDNKTLREFAHVVEERDVKPDTSSVSSSTPDDVARDALSEVLGWVLGRGKVAPVLDDSRRIVKLAQVVANEIGRKALRANKSLDEALQVVSEEGAAPLDSAKRMLTSSANGLRKAIQQIELLDALERKQVAPLLSPLEIALQEAKALLHGGKSS